MSTGNFNAGMLPCDDAHNGLASYAVEGRNTQAIHFMFLKPETCAGQMGNWVHMQTLPLP